MSHDENKNIIFRWYEAVNQGDINLIDKLAEKIFSPDFYEHDPRMPDFEGGPAGVKKFIRQVLKENAGLRVTVHDIFSFEDKTAYRFTVSMTDIESGNPINVQLIAIARFVGDQITEEWELGVQGKW